MALVSGYSGSLKTDQGLLRSKAITQPADSLYEPREFTELLAHTGDMHVNRAISHDVVFAIPITSSTCPKVLIGFSLRQIVPAKYSAVDWKNSMATM
jgi:hypothetical protein